MFVNCCHFTIQNPQNTDYFLLNIYIRLCFEIGTYHLIEIHLVFNKLVDTSYVCLLESMHEETIISSILCGFVEQRTHFFFGLKIKKKKSISYKSASLPMGCEL